MRGVHRQRIPFDHAEFAGPDGRDFGQRGQAAGVFFDRQHMARPFGQKRAGQPAGARPHFEDIGTIEGGRDPGDARGQVQIEKEVLPQRLACAQVVASDHLAQGGEGVDAHARARPVAMVCASLSAARRLEGSARPLPAMS